MDLHRFGDSAIDELNGCRTAPREPAKNFVSLMIGLFILLLVLYALIIWTTGS
jgi:hypothetical protein